MDAVEERLAIGPDKERALVLKSQREEMARIAREDFPHISARIDGEEFPVWTGGGDQRFSSFVVDERPDVFGVFELREELALPSAIEAVNLGSRKRRRVKHIFRSDRERRDEHPIDLAKTRRSAIFCGVDCAAWTGAGVDAPARIHGH